MKAVAVKRTSLESRAAAVRTREIQNPNFSHFYFSLVVHPNKLLIATGQASGHDRREGRVRETD